MAIPFGVQPPPQPFHFGLPQTPFRSQSSNSAAGTNLDFPFRKWASASAPSKSSSVSVGTGLSTAFSAGASINPRKQNVYNIDATRFIVFFRNSSGHPSFRVIDVNSAGAPTAGNATTLVATSLTFIDVRQSNLQKNVFLVLLSDGSLYKADATTAGIVPATPLQLATGLGTNIGLAVGQTVMEWGRAEEDCVVFSSKAASTTIKVALYSYSGSSATYVANADQTVASASVSTKPYSQFNSVRGCVDIILGSDSTSTAWFLRFTATPAALTLIITQTVSVTMVSGSSIQAIDYNTAQVCTNTSVTNSSYLLLQDSGATVVSGNTTLTNANITGYINGVDGGNGLWCAIGAGTFDVGFSGQKMLLPSSSSFSFGMNSVTNFYGLAFNAAMDTVVTFGYDGTTNYMIGAANVSTL